MRGLSQARIDGEEQPGWKWGPFTLRVPFLHTGIEWPELLQGMIVAGATGLALVPLLMIHFEFTFEQSLAIVFIQSMLISSAPIIFGEPYAPGWITPALPLVLAYMGNSEFPYTTPEEKIQFMTATSLTFALLVLVLGLTGLGGKFLEWLPDSLKGGIIMGAAIAALYKVFLDPAHVEAQPVSTITAVALCLILTFSLPVQKLKAKWKLLAVLAGLGLLPGFLAGALVGPLVGEVQYDIEWGLAIPPFVEVIEKVSPFSIGWPEWSMFVNGFPLALMGYVILFGDLVTGMEVLKGAVAKRPDEKIVIDVNRSHHSIAIRNALMALFAPFFPTQGCLWTGVHVIIVQRWQEGRNKMDSLYSGIASYYVFGVPLLYLVLPLVTGLKPLMGIALSLTLVLTGFACSYVAMGIPKTQIERGVVILTGVALAVFSPWIGMTVGVIATILLVGPTNPDTEGQAN
ncbi:MAG: hypothetical protein H6751_18430 [Candidatus Omnitrophica bacterium]|nr:hypothetical protein [Candidatus Omnitrophota bacterium]MCB9766989.1 hypothetical protein [Candidatus Omnitrophota bacterium]MCB9784953.1 hypothetical protein [Candidatus Omnitrophota bacterium]